MKAASNVEPGIDHTPSCTLFEQSENVESTVRLAMIKIICAGRAFAKSLRAQKHGAGIPNNSSMSVTELHE